MTTYTKKYTHHLKPNERVRNGDHWVWYTPGSNISAYSMYRDAHGLYAVNLRQGNLEARGVGMTPLAAYRQAYRALRQATRHDLQDVFRELGDLRRKFNRLLAQRAGLLRELNAAKQSTTDGDLRAQVRDLRDGLAAAQSAQIEQVDGDTWRVALPDGEAGDAESVVEGQLVPASAEAAQSDSSTPSAPSEDAAPVPAPASAEEQPADTTLVQTPLFVDVERSDAYRALVNAEAGK